MASTHDSDARDLASFLQQVFACAPDVAEAIGRRTSERRFAAADLVIRQGDAVGEAFLMRQGRARAVAYTREGQAVLLQEFTPGDLFGALAEARNAASPADISAVEASRMAVFVSLELLALAERHGCVGLALARSLMKQLQAATDRMVARTTLSAVGRIYAELLRLADQADGRTIRPAPILAALAGRVQTTRETASRAVNALERRGIVRRDGEALSIVARRQLEDLVV